MTLRGKAAIYNDYIEEFWRSLVQNGGSNQLEAEYKAVLLLAEAHGFVYKSATDIAKLPLDDIVSRVQQATKKINSPDTVEAVLGGQDAYQIKLSECIEKFWELSKPATKRFTCFGITNWKSPGFGEGLTCRTFGAQRPTALNAHTSLTLSPF